MKIKLTEKALEALAPPTEAPQAYYWDTDDTGFGLVVGRTGVKTFVVYARVGKNKVKVKIGLASPGPWNVARARRRAKELLGQMAAGQNPNAPSDATAATSHALTLRQAMELHLAEMADKKRRKISIDTLRYDVTRLLADALDRPLAELTVEAVQKIKKRGRSTRTQSNRLHAPIQA